MVDAIFASYSHRDAAIVDQFEQYARALGNEYLRDSINLRAGEVLSDRLRQMIDQADAFQLFWSRTLMHSLFVRQEYEYALSLNQRNFVRPTFPLLGDSCTLGRGRGDINFPDDGYVSGLHARVSLRDGRVFLADLGSSNGTFIKVNGARAIGHESFVLLGQQLFRVELA